MPRSRGPNDEGSRPAPLIITTPHPTVAAVELHGSLQRADIERAILALLAHPAYVGGMNELWDFRNAHIARIQASDLMALARFVALHLERLGKRTAIVVGRDVDYGVARMWEGYAEQAAPQERRVFRDRDEAMAWLVPAAAHPESTPQPASA